MNKPRQAIKQLLKSHYSEQQLRPEQLDQLLALQSSLSTTPDEADSASAERLSLTGPRGLAAACVLILTVGLWSLSLAPNSNRAIVEEIASNHLQPLQLDVGSSSLAEVNRQLKHLSFSLVESARLDTSTWELIGGRYCTIQGQLAAQLKLLNKQNHKIVTLYQSALPQSSNNPLEDTILRSEQGVEVSFWWEGEVMLALAQ